MNYMPEPAEQRILAKIEIKTTTDMTFIYKRTITMAVIAVLLLAGTAIIFKNMRKNKEIIDSDAYIAKSGIVIENGQMTPEALLAFGRISDPQVSPDGKHILYGVSYTSVEDNRSCRNLYICDIDGGNNHQITYAGKSINNARWSADGKRILFLEGGQLYVSKVKSSKGLLRIANPKKLSDIANGISEFALSPDEKKILFVSTVKSAVKSSADCYPDLDKGTAFETDDLMYRHWDHTVMEIQHSFVADFSYKKGIGTATDLLEGELFELPAEPFGGIEQLCWSPDSKYIAYSCRKLTGKKYAFSTNAEIYIYSLADGSHTLVKMGGGYDTDPVWSPDGSRLAWISMARDGYEADKQRLMCIDIKDGKPAGEVRDLSAPFKYNAAGLVWSADSKSIYFNALAEGIQGIFRWSEDGIVRLTGEDAWYDFGSPFHIIDNEDGSQTLLTSWCSMDFPTELVAVNISGTSSPEGYENAASQVLKADCPVIDKTVSYSPVTTENQHILSQLAPHKTEARQVRTVDGKDMLTWVLYPPQFDETKTYPSILICLGGPQGTISQSWSYRWNYRLMAAQGYVVVLPNRRGTTAFGQEWTEQISGDYCGLNMQDYLAAARELKSEPYIGKMAACGASYGGYSVYYLCGVHGDVFDAFIAHAGIFNEEHMYMTTEEMWFPNWDNGGLEECSFHPLVGTPQCPVGPAGDGKTFGGILQGGSPWSTLPKAQRHYANSPHKLVTNWHTPLMVIHGGMDYRVPVDEGMAAYNAAQMMGVPSRLLVFPDENHWILKPQNALLWHREYFRWLDQWCK